MTVNYSSEVTSCTRFGVSSFLKLLGRWRGSIYKIVWTDLVLYLAVYYLLNLLYLYGLEETYGRRHFINIVTYFSKYGNLIPLSFVLGFYVNVVYNRWWSQYSCIPYPDNIAILVGASIHGKDERAKMIRRTIIRYVCVAFTLTLRTLSPKVKKRFPTLDHFVHAGLLNRDERAFIEELDNEYPSYIKYWLPLAWAANVTTRAKAEGIIQHELGLKDILEEINAFRGQCKKLLDFDWICVPLVYTQVVTLAVYLYFLFTVIGSQFIEEQKEGDTIVFKFPLMSLVEFFFYMGWLKVAESLINPFGEDDDDFEVVWMIDRHLQVGYLLVDKIHEEHPVLTKDMHWEKVAPQQLPFTVASQKFMFECPVESTNTVKIRKNDDDLIIPEWGKSREPLRDTGFKRFLSSFAKRSRLPPDLKLQRVAAGDNLVFDDFNVYDGEPVAVGGEERMEDVKEFEKMRNERLEKRKEDTLRYFEIIAEIWKEDREKAKKLIDELLR